MATWEVTFNPQIAMDSLVPLFTEIEAFKLSVSKIPLPPHLAQEIDKIIIVHQIKGTTGIEGNTLSEDQIKEVIGASTSEEHAPFNEEEQEVINADKVLQWIRRTIKEQSSPYITEELIGTLHQITTNGCGYPGNTPGRYRQHRVTAGEFTPPDHQEVPRLMEEFITFINSREAIERYRPLIRAIVAHFYLITIHPFGDGNGRTSRALEAYILCQGGYNVRGFYSLANYFYRHRQQYIDHLQATRFSYHGNLTEFIRFALEGYVQELQNIQDLILEYARRVMFRDLYLQTLQNGPTRGRGIGVMEFLTFYAQEGIPIEAYRNRTHRIIASIYRNLSPKTILRDLTFLQEQGLVVLHEGVIKANLDLMNDY